jgi:pilus assembly protein CpaF
VRPTALLGPLEPVLADEAVTEVLLNGPGQAWVERSGRLERLALDLDEEVILGLVERVIGPLGLRLDRSSPMVDARLPDGSRLHAVLPPIAVDGPCVAIRRFGAGAFPLAAFGLDGEGAALLEWAVRAGWNLLVAGGTGAGKTTLLNSLSALVPADERIVTIEETAELRLTSPHVVRLEARPANAEGAGAVSVRDLVRAALRLRPDRLLVGEVRGAEAFDMVQALNTGHDGSLSTIHAGGPAQTLARLETLVLLADAGLPLGAVRSQIGASIDAVVYVARGGDRGRRVLEVAEVTTTAGELGVRPLLAGSGPRRLHRPARRAGSAPWPEGWVS